MAHYSNFNNRAIELPTLPAQPTEFERTAARLGLVTDEQQKNSSELKAWAHRHHNNRFVPENLLKHWHIEVFDAQGRLGAIKDFGE